jgi:hypothetical protein
MKAPVREFEVPIDQQDAVYTALASRVSDDAELLTEVPASYIDNSLSDLPMSSLAAGECAPEDFDDRVVLRDEDEIERPFNEGAIESLL